LYRPCDYDNQAQELIIRKDSPARFEFGYRIFDKIVNNESLDLPTRHPFDFWLFRLQSKELILKADSRFIRKKTCSKHYACRELVVLEWEMELISSF